MGRHKGMWSGLRRPLRLVLRILTTSSCSAITLKGVSLQFKEEVRKIKGLVWHGVKNGTDLWQPVDGGIGRIITILIKHEQQVVGD